MDSLLPLRDIHLPPPIGWWPPAPGWWLLIPAALLLFLAVTLFRRRKQGKAAQRNALRELGALQRNAGLASTEKAQQLSILLRRVALSLYPREEVAGLNGPAWLDWLERTLADGRFVAGPGRLLNELPYRKDIADDDRLEALFALCRDWLERLPSRRSRPAR